MRTRFLVILLASLFLVTNEAKAQYVFGTTGLLHLPTAEMQQDKTLMIGASFLPEESTPDRWPYDTYNYYFSITILPFVEFSYCLALFTGDYLSNWGLNPQHFDHWANQDRDFSIRVRCIEEGQWWKYMPQIVIGANDCLHTVSAGSGKSPVGFWSSGNGNWGRLYIAATKHFNTGSVGELAVHAAYMYNEREDFLFRGPGAGVDYHLTLDNPNFFAQTLNGLHFIGEYDSNRVNLGLRLSLFNDRFNIINEFYDCRYYSGGIQFKIFLK